MRDVLRYALTDWHAEASKLGYIPLSGDAAALILQQLGPVD
jgi:phosphate transport system substrate-binding protein